MNDCTDSCLFFLRLMKTPFSTSEGYIVYAYTPGKDETILTFENAHSQDDFPADHFSRGGVPEAITDIIPLERTVQYRIAIE